MRQDGPTSLCHGLTYPTSCLSWILPQKLTVTVAEWTSRRENRWDLRSPCLGFPVKKAVRDIPWTAFVVSRTGHEDCHALRWKEQGWGRG